MEGLLTLFVENQLLVVCGLAVLGWFVYKNNKDDKEFRQKVEEYMKQSTKDHTSVKKDIEHLQKELEEVKSDVKSGLMNHINEHKK